MLGMFQLITHLVGFLLVLQAVAIFQTALVSDGKYRILGRVIGLIVIAVAVVVSAHYITMVDSHAARISQEMLRHFPR